MPARATPTGSPIASTDPKARISTIMAKASPKASELGTSNSAKIWPPISIWTPSMAGISSFMSAVISWASSNVISRGRR